jgi:hypothetical protein
MSGCRRRRQIPVATHKAFFGSPLRARRGIYFPGRCERSSLRLAAAGAGNSAPKSPLSHSQFNGSASQDFCLEDAGDGWF